MDLMTIAEQIKDKIKLLEQMRNVIKQRGESKAVAISDYEKKLAVVIIQLKNGKIFEVDNEVISGESLPANLLEKIAKGICWKEKLDMETADASYKSAITNIETVQAELNALQSLNRHLEVA